MTQRILTLQDAKAKVEGILPEDVEVYWEKLHHGRVARLHIWKKGWGKWVDTTINLMLTDGCVEGLTDVAWLAEWDSLRRDRALAPRCRGFWKEAKAIIHKVRDTILQDPEIPTSPEERVQWQRNFSKPIL